jgi:exodeoxyribonuclease III
VNGIRARAGQVIDWISRDAPDIVCLQEIKARPDQLPPLLFEPEGYWCRWHGHGGYSGVAIFVKKTLSPEPPRFVHPAFDFESRVLTVELTDVRVASVYVPNGGKDFPAKMGFLEQLVAWAGESGTAGPALVVCGDLNVAHTDQDLHPKERKAGCHRPAARGAAAIRSPARSGPCGRRPIAGAAGRVDVLVVGAVAQPAAAEHRLENRLRARFQARWRPAPRRAPCSPTSARATMRP